MTSMVVVDGNVENIGPDEYTLVPCPKCGTYLDWKEGADFYDEVLASPLANATCDCGEFYELWPQTYLAVRAERLDEEDDDTD